MRLRLWGLVAAMVLMMAATPAVGNQNRAQLSDAAAGCTYGTRQLQESDYARANAFTTYTEYREYFNQMNGSGANDCSVSWQWFPPAPGWGISYVVAGSSAAFGGPAATSNPTASRDQVACTGLTDPNCAASKFSSMPGGGSLHMVANTYHCESDADFNCISKIEVIDPEGKTQLATFERHFPDMPKVDGATWQGDGQTMVASPGKSPALWTYSTSAGTKRLLTQGILEMQWNANPGSSAWTNPFQSMRFALLPVEIGKSWQASKPVVKSVPWTDGDGTSVTSVLPLYNQPTDPKPADFVESANCRGFQMIQQADHECAYETTFPDGYRYRLTFQMQDFAGFSFMGRLDTPIAYSEAMTGGHRLIVDAAPSQSYLVSANVPKAVMTPTFISAVQKGMVYNPGAWTQNPVDNPPMESRDPDFLAALAPFIGDRSQFKYPAWNFYSLPVNGGMSRTCQDQVRGQVVSITSTNATAFDQNGPTFDQATKTFTFKAAAPHFEPDGKTPAVGHYYMNMNAQFMKCVLGTAKVPEMAAVALDYVNGEVNAATVTVHLDKDWLRLAADNFHFSSPTIKVTFPKLESAASSAPKTVAMKSTVTCVKGKAVKKVSAVNPKCPAGWKKR